MAKPQWRERDEHPMREDDLRLTTPLGTVEASGRNIIIIIMMLALVALGFYHHHMLSEDHRQFRESQQKFIEAMILHTCVIALDEKERKEFRREQKYCGSWETQKELQKVIKPEAKE